MEFSPTRVKLFCPASVTSGEKKRILVDSIFGVDIDFQAVEVAKLNLLLKVLEGDQPELIDRQLRLMRERALPDLDRNLQLGNTLVGPSFFTGKLVGAEELNAVKPFDWKGKFPGCFTQQAPGFEVVIGNPPYGASISESTADYFQANFHLQDYQLDSYMLFVEKSLRLLRPSGRLGMIIPNTWLLNLSTAKIRRFIFENSTIESVIHFQKPVFKATVDTEIVILRNEKPDPDHRIQIAIVDRDGKQLRYSVPQTCLPAGLGSR